MKKLLPILIGLSLSGFSTLSQAENLMQVYQQARLSNPGNCVNPLPIAMLHSKKLTKRVVLYCRNWV
ncbi:outer membrane protein TolC [Salmonella enterica subsp. arizonae]|uniref:Outer membrane protein TolC n=1 Tax=Salmonella enterica subsp. arizonae TaxID=59203 RepID=A0A379T5Y6_SALER|nr:outer membrane protein TolC [Salmonella enterica subsp. arizonae]